MFELSQVRCLVAVAEELHFGRAAARLNMTQPPLSRQIQILERILGVMLLRRGNRLVKLTPNGQSFLTEARLILKLTESAALLARRVAEGKAEPMIAAVPAGHRLASATATRAERFSLVSS